VKDELKINWICEILNLKREHKCNVAMTPKKNERTREGNCSGREERKEVEEGSRGKENQRENEEKEKEKEMEKK
jgi:hypothetical protein